MPISNQHPYVETEGFEKRKLTLDLNIRNLKTIKIKKGFHGSLVRIITNESNVGPVKYR